VSSAVAVRDISDQSLAVRLSAFTISSAAAAGSDASRRRVDAVSCHCAATAVGMSDSETKVDADTEKTSVMAASENSIADSVARTGVNSAGSLPLLPSTSDEGCQASDSVKSMLSLLHGLSHCSYHEPSLLVLTEHFAYDAAADLFVYLWHGLQTSQQDDKIWACIFAFHV